MPLTFPERQFFERLLQMGGGYVLNFSNNNFEEFFRLGVGVNIYAPEYNYASGSKANRLRGFWNVAPDHLVGRALRGLLDMVDGLSQERRDRAIEIIVRLESQPHIPDLDALEVDFTDDLLERHAQAIRHLLQQSRADEAVDRMHTFTVLYFRNLSDAHNLPYDRDATLQYLCSAYVRDLRADGTIETVMGERILRNTLSTMDAFSSVRNDHSMAHGNPVVNVDEGWYILSTVLATFKFIRSVERRRLTRNKQSSLDDVPF
ncbi:MAG: hypothetical protein D8M52_04400 [Chlorobi bacterium]|nr:MAG: abortive infection family protein [Bacteroidota bacterium]MBL1160944.1 hypothetical protein [Chlorobiota bacterium]MBW7852903.1 hypothetical protein [Candidatus Kapabacteria bacterium]MCC6330866.1 hypothetical protein [Ignavibacteria bacterium]MCL4276582.1 hypothetical protein [Ignavibacteria bacterium]